MDTSIYYKVLLNGETVKDGFDSHEGAFMWIEKEGEYYTEYEIKAFYYKRY